MSVRKFERLLKAAGLRAERRRYASVAGLPLLRELFVNHVTAVLEVVAEERKAGTTPSPLGGDAEMASPGSPRRNRRQWAARRAA